MHNSLLVLFYAVEVVLASVKTSKFYYFHSSNILPIGILIEIKFKRALRENFERLKQAIAEGKIGPEALEEYKRILKQTLAKACKFIEILRLLRFFF